MQQPSEIEISDEIAVELIREAAKLAKLPATNDAQADARTRLTIAFYTVCAGVSEHLRHIAYTSMQDARELEQMKAFLLRSRDEANPT